MDGNFNTDPNNPADLSDEQLSVEPQYMYSSREKPTGQRNMYSQISATSRPLDRIRRPAPSLEEANYQDLIEDLNFGFADVPGLETEVETNVMSETQPIPVVEAPPVQQELTYKQPAEQTVSQSISLPKLRVRPVFIVLLMATILLACSVGAYRLAEKYFAVQPVNNSQSEASWRKAQAEWKCTIQQYQANQDNAVQAPHAPATKEKICAN